MKPIHAEIEALTPPRTPYLTGLRPNPDKVELRSTAEVPERASSISRLQLLSRVSCFLSIALGILSLLMAGTGQTGGAIGLFLVGPNEALGLIFMGFAVRMSRLEAHSLTIRIVVRTSRTCLLLHGLSTVAGVGVLELIPSTAPIRHAGQFTLAAGICNLLIGSVLILKSRYPKSRIQSAFTVLVGAFLGSCWISLLLFHAGLAPIPAILQIDTLALLVTSGICVVLSSAARIPGILKVLSEGGPEAEAARILFPMAFAIPLALAFLRHRAELQGLLARDLGLLLHVLFSAGSMAVMIVWNANRISSARRILASTKAAIEEVESQYRDVLAVCVDPVWIFSPEGDLLFQNDAADKYSATQVGARRPSSGQDCVLGTTQQGALLSAALFGRKVAELRLFDSTSGKPRVLDIKFLRALLTERGEPRAVIVVARDLEPAT